MSERHHRPPRRSGGAVVHVVTDAAGVKAYGGTIASMSCPECRKEIIRISCSDCNPTEPTLVIWGKLPGHMDIAGPHPPQPTYTDSHGTIRFKGNAIVRFLLDAGPHDLNKIALMNFSDDDRRQFAQLIGYSVSGYHDLDYSQDEETP